MINKPTVLILGAGASAHLNYPIGIGLRERIINNLSVQSSEQFKELLRMGQRKEVINGFISEFRYSPSISVDAFLEHQTKYIDVGKLAIAQALIPQESLDALFPVGRLSWYHYIFKKMGSSFDDFGKNKISFISFNYDRSLEHFFYVALKNLYGRNQQEVSETLSLIKIIHLHGVLDDLPWQFLEGRDYTGVCVEDQLKRAADKIRIIHESISGDEAFTQAKGLLNDARLICFLGFGYDPTNMNRLEINSLHAAGVRLYGTCFDLATAERNQVTAYFTNGRYGLRLGSPNHDVLNFLRESINFE